jgi:recombination protein RecR
MEGSAIEKLIADISKLPGLGRRSAQRIALYLLKNKDRSLLPLIQTLESSHKLISECSACGNVDMTNPCNICSSANRDQKSICIIEDVSDLWTFERTGFYRGLHHVLGGSLSAINGIGMEELTITKLVKRIEQNEIT